MGRKKVTGKSEPVVEEPILPPRLALSILEFCDAHGISEWFYYKLKKQRKGPREMRLGTRTWSRLKARPSGVASANSPAQPRPRRPQPSAKPPARPTERRPRTPLTPKAAPKRSLRNPPAVSVRKLTPNADRERFRASRSCCGETKLKVPRSGSAETRGRIRKTRSARS